MTHFVGDSADDLVTVLGLPGLVRGISSVDIRMASEVDACPGDATGDGVVSVDDILFIINSWGGPGGDVTGDGITGVDDMLLCLANFGNCG